MEQEYLTIDTVADTLGVHPKTIRRYISSGKLSAQKIGGSWRIHPESIQQYISSCEKASCGHREENVSKDDFCIFMDSDYFNSEETIQVCSIVDYYVKQEKVKALLQDVMAIVAEQSLENRNSRFNYIYDDADKKMRLVFWGAPSYMEKVMVAIKPYEIEET